MPSASPESICPAGSLCFPYESYSDFIYNLNTRIIAPPVIGLTFYGIFIVLFSISIYIFRQRFLPGKFYVVATILFFALGTTSAALELARIAISPLYPFFFVYSIPSEGRLNSVDNFEIALDSIFIVSGLLSDALLNSKKRIVVVPALGLLASFDAGAGAGRGRGWTGRDTVYVRRNDAVHQESVILHDDGEVKPGDPNLPSIVFGRIQTKPDLKKPRKQLSIGYGFVGFRDVEGAKKAIKGLQGYVLDGHALHVKFAGRVGGDEDDGSAATAKDRVVGLKSQTTKMVVKNVLFEAMKDIQDLFGTHGQLKSVRLTKKFNSRTRGFAFLEFVSRYEAENVYEALRYAHLLGKHLVLEWAEEGE
ncbi:hypothetical protein GYMLUDRAFT_245874 [Collybiopsis luxurians FD-317 M1]|uniref:Unplaced genomic scaffold GYMLUscaffold_35, whole genome shotgun sequence n=1 Tax=Collybiopsis luxurians FD-317 M1 TaxID=944289 RepID=A0A0D0CK35_9AGAR|nr:hypothetical protein GYMLUDRAFT_245874 [Collybiopsis luxurians FD-317 M1]